MDLSDAYANAAHIPGGDAFPARWAAAAAAFRAAHPPEALRYSEGGREWLHLFRPAGKPRGLVAFVHGGYWMAFSPLDFSHLAAGPLARGWAVALPAYPLCPEAGIGAIVRAVARAVERAAGEVPGPVHLAGHSAGGHVVSRLACADVALPVRDRLARVVPISPLANLLPLMSTGLNATLRLDAAEAVAESPLLRPRPSLPVTVWVGEDERPAFRDQALWLSRAWEAPLVVEPGRHHFDVIAGLEDPQGALTLAVLGEGPPSGGTASATCSEARGRAAPSTGAAARLGPVRLLGSGPAAIARGRQGAIKGGNLPEPGPPMTYLPLAAPLARAVGLCAVLALAACAAPPPPEPEQFVGGVPVSQIVPGYGLIEDGGYTLPPVPLGYLQGVNRRAVVPYRGDLPPGTIEIDPHAKFLYWIEPGGMATRYPIAVGREGRDISGRTTIQRKAEWPGWTPTANMLRREPEIYGPFAGGVPGGLANPLGARALYLYRNGRDTFYRIHGTNDLSSIGNSGSAGCIRMFNHDAIDLFNRVPMGTDVVIRSYEDSVRIEGPLMANRGIELPAFYGDSQRPPVDQAMVPEQFYGNPAAQAGVAYVPDPADPYPGGLGAAVSLPAATGVIDPVSVEIVGGAGYAPVLDPTQG